MSATPRTDEAIANIGCYSAFGELHDDYGCLKDECRKLERELAESSSYAELNLRWRRYGERLQLAMLELEERTRPDGDMADAPVNALVKNALLDAFDAYQPRRESEIVTGYDEGKPGGDHAAKVTGHFDERTGQLVVHDIEVTKSENAVGTIPDGWKLVPVEPTKRMTCEAFIRATEVAPDGWSLGSADSQEFFGAIYRHMLKTSPEPVLSQVPCQHEVALDPATGLPSDRCRKCGFVFVTMKEADRVPVGRCPRCFPSFCWCGGDRG